MSKSKRIINSPLKRSTEERLLRLEATNKQIFKVLKKMSTIMNSNFAKINTNFDALNKKVDSLHNSTNENFSDVRKSFKEVKFELKKIDITIGYDGIYANMEVAKGKKSA